MEGLIELWAAYLTKAGSLRIFPNIALKLSGAIEVYSMPWCDFDWLRNVVWSEKEKMWHLTNSEEYDEVDGTYC